MAINIKKSSIEIPYIQSFWSLFRPRVKAYKTEKIYPTHYFKSVNFAELSSKPESLPCLRRDEKDTILMKIIIEKEYRRLFTESRDRKLDPELQKEFTSFCNGVWEAYGALADLYMEERSPTNERLGLDSDHWYEINTSNAALFQDLRLRGIGELLPGRLFSTRMPRDLVNHPENAKEFQTKTQEYNLHTVVVLAESMEYDKYAGTDIEVFYSSLGLEAICRPFEDFSIPDQPHMMANIKDVLWRLSEGKNVLVHCAGGNGRTGMLIAGVVRNVGVKDPVTWVRRIKSSYVETAQQEAFVNSLPVALDTRICERHPLLELAITAEFLLNLITPGHETVKMKMKISETPPPSMTATELAGIEKAFELIANQKSGYLSIADLERVFIQLGVDDAQGSAEAVLHHKDGADNCFFSKQEFISLVSQKMVTTSRHY